MAVRPRGNGWQADVQWKGRRAREQFTSQQAAERWAAAALDALKTGKPVPKPSPITGSVGAYDTIADLVRVVRRTNWDAKPGAHQLVSASERFLDFVGRNVAPVDALTQANVDAWITGLVEERMISGATVNRHLSAVSVICKRALSAGLIPRKLDLSWQKEGEARLRWYSEDEEALIRQTLMLWSRPDWHDFFVVLVDTGARTWTEAGRLSWQDVTERPRMVTFWDTKNGDSRSVPLTTRAWEAIERQRGNNQRGPFTALHKDDGRRLYDRIRTHLPHLADTVWYTARHTFASRLVQRGVDLYRVQKLMGHRSIEMTMRYAKLAPTQLIDAIAVLEQPAGPRLAVDNVA